MGQTKILKSDLHASIQNTLSGVEFIKGKVATVAALNGLTASAGDVYYVESEKMLYRYTGTAWETGSTGGGGSGATTLDALTDVSSSSATTGQVLQFNGLEWVPATMAESSHTHIIQNVTGLQTELDAKASAADVAALTTTVGEKSEIGHNHVVGDVTGLQGLLDAKADDATTLTGYGITDAYTKTEVDTSLSGKSNSDHTHTSEEISFETSVTDFPANSSNVKLAIENLFTYANSGKSAIAGAIGYPSSPAYDGTFDLLASTIQASSNDLKAFLTNAEQTFQSTDKIDALVQKLSQVRVFKQTVKFRQSNFYTLSLKSPVEESKMCITVYQLINDGNTEEFEANFDNSESGNFNYDANSVMFDGAMKLKTTTATSTQSTSESNIYTFSFDVSGVSDFRINTIVSNTSTSISVDYETLPTPKAVWANGPIDISDVSSIESIALGAANSGAGKFRLAVSVDGGNEFKAWNGSSWITVFNSNTPNSVSTFGASGMTMTIASSLTYAEFEQLIGSSTDIRFAYYLEQPKFSDVASVNLIRLNGRAKGSFKPVGSSVAATIKPIFEYMNNQSIRVYFDSPSVVDTYRINYIDTI